MKTLKPTSNPLTLGTIADPRTQPLPAETEAKESRPSKIFARLRVVIFLALLILIARLMISGFYLTEDTNSNLSGLTEPSPAEASRFTLLASPSAPLVAEASLPAATAGVAALPAAGITSPMLAGAAVFFETAANPSLVTSAQATIPLPPGEEDLRLPQRPQTPPTNSSPTGPTTPATGPPPVTAGPGGNTTQPCPNSEELARREFDVNRREIQLNTREDALRQLERDVNLRLQQAEKAEANINEIVEKNNAILAEQKNLREEQQKNDAALKSARVEHLVAAFKGMKPEQAGTLINSMDDQVAVAILSAMPGSNAGKILAMVNPDKAARLIKAISEQRVDPKVLLENSQYGGAGNFNP
ncbi:MAG: hypothetical protein LBF22_08605 [Deltaproteobacteria bacterium]|nr:hypothetical protein [Deltaproteobacteria bacterium]